MILKEELVWRVGLCCVVQVVASDVGMSLLHVEGQLEFKLLAREPLGSAPRVWPVRFL